MADLRKTFELAFAIGGKLDPSFKSAHSEAAASIAKLSQKSQEAMAFSKLQKEYKSALSDFKSAASETSAAWGNVFNSIAGPIKQIATLGAVAGAAVYGLAATTANFGDKAVKTAKKVGLNTEEYSKLAYAAQQSNISQEEFSGSLIKFNQLIAKAYKGNDDAQFAFKRAGVNIKDTSGKLKDTKQILLEASNMFERMPEGIYKADLAMALFGKSAGPNLVPLMEQGSKKIGKLGDDAARLGIIFDDLEGEKAVNFSGSMTELKAAVQGLGFSVGKLLLEPLTKVNEAVVEWITTNREFISMKVNEFIKDTITWVKQNKDAIIGLKDSVVQFIGQIGVWIEKNGGLFEVVKKVGQAFIALKALGIAFAIMGAVASTATFIASIAGLIVKTKLLIAAFGGFKVIAGLIAGAAAPVAFVAAAVVSLGVATYLLIKNWSEVVYFFKNMAVTVPIFINDLVEDIKGLFGGLPGWIQVIVAPIKNIITSPIQAVQDLLAGNIKGFITNMGKFIISKILLVPLIIANAGNAIIKAIFGVDIIGAIKEWISPVITVISNILGAGIDAIVDFFVGEFNGVKDAFGEGFFNGIFTILKKIPTLFFRMGIDVIKAVTAVDISPVMDRVNGIFRGIKAIFTGIGGLVSASFRAVAGFIGGELAAIKQAFAGGFINGIGSILSRVPTFFVRMAADVIKAITGIDLISVGKQWIGGLVSAVGAAASGLVSVVSAAIRGFTNVFSGELAAIKQAFSGVFNAVLSIVNNIGAAITAAASGFMSGVSAMFYNVWNTVGEIFSGAITKIKSLFSDGFLVGITNIIKNFNFISIINNLVNKIFDIDLLSIGKNWIAKLIDGILAGIKSAGAAVKDALGGVIPKAADLLGGAVGAVAKVIPKFSEGGIATAPSLAAEDGRPEAIIPLTKPRRAVEVMRQVAAQFPNIIGFAKPEAAASPRPQTSVQTPLERLQKITSVTSNKSVSGSTFNFSAPITINGIGGADASAVKTSVETAVSDMKNKFEQWFAEFQRAEIRVAAQ